MDTDKLIADLRGLIPAAFEAFADRYSPGFISFGLFCGYKPDEARNLAEACIETIALKASDPTQVIPKGRLDEWVYKEARDSLVRSWQMGDRERSKLIEFFTLVETLEKAMSRLPKFQRELLEQQRRFPGRSDTEVAESLQVAIDMFKHHRGCAFVEIQKAIDADPNLRSILDYLKKQKAQ
jgi:hypothetical protein